MSVVLTMQDDGPSRKRLEVEVPAAAVEAESRRVVAEFRARAKVPGFRKGKVPPNLVRQRYGDDIRQEIVDRLVPRYWKQAADEKELDPLLPPQIEDVDLDEEWTALRFVATVEVRPEIALGEIRDLELPELEVHPTDEEVDQAIEDLRKDIAEWVPVDRPAGMGDQVKAHLVELDEAGAPGRTQVVSLEVGDPRIWDELTAAATGLAADDEAELARPAGPEGGERRYRLRVNAVLERELPELDDAFASRLGAEDLAALRSEVERRLRAARLDERRRRRERAALDQLRERHPLALPKGVVDAETEDLVRDYAEDLVRRGVDLEKTGMDWDAVRDQARPQAERRVHDRLLLDAIAQAEAVEVGEEEFEGALAGIARAQGATTVQLRQALDRNGRLQLLRRQMRRDKALRGLLPEDPVEAAEQAVPGRGETEPEPTKPEPAEPEPTKEG